MTGRTLLVPDTSGAPRRHESGSSPVQTAGTLWLVRHGESGWNVARRIQGQSPAAPGLTATGRSQAAEAARELARRAPRADLIVASDLARAAETAEIIAARLGLPVEFDPGLREQSLGALEGRQAFVAAGADGDDLLNAFWEGPFRTPPGGESVAGMYDRVHRALNRITAAHPGADLIVVTHGGPVRVAAAAHRPEPGQAFPRTDVGNASITPYRPPSR
jgi:probable phosphoglycerate mutase